MKKGRRWGRLLLETGSEVMQASGKVAAVLVSQDCHNKIPPTGGLKQQKLIAHRSGVWEVYNQGASRLGSWCGLVAQPVDGHRLIVSSHGRERVPVSLPLLIRAPAPLN